MQGKAGKISVFPVLAVGVICLLMFLSWTPDPRMRSISWLPEFVTAWADENTTSRTGFGMFLLGLVVGFWNCSQRQELRNFLWYLLGMSGMVLLMELVQVVLPNRVFDWYDVLWGIGGGQFGVIFAFAIDRVRSAFRSAIIRRKIKKFSHY